MGTNGLHERPLYKDWRLVLVRYKEALWERIKNTIAFRDEDMNRMPLIRRMTLSTAAHRYRDYRMELYKKYYLDKEPRVRRICPQNFDPDQWSKMVDYWDSPEWQGKLIKNKVICAKQTMGHTSGSKSNARARKDYNKLRGGFPDPLSFFRFTHTKKDNSWNDEPSQEKGVSMDNSLQS